VGELDQVLTYDSLVSGVGAGESPARVLGGARRQCVEAVAAAAAISATARKMSGNVRRLELLWVLEEGFERLGDGGTGCSCELAVEAPMARRRELRERRSGVGARGRRGGLK
jgi:hypothetical protein